MLTASFMEQKLPKPSNHHQRERLGLGIPNDATHHSLEPRRETSSMIDLLPQWGSRKKFRFTKNSEATGDDELLLSSPVRKITNARLDRKSVAVKDRFDYKQYHTDRFTSGGGGGRSGAGGCGNFNCHSASAPPTTRRVLRNSEIMRVQQTNGGGVNQDKKKHHHHHQNQHENGGGSSDFDGKKGGIVGGGGSSSSSEAVPAVWPHKFVIALTNKEKEEDFMAIKGTKLPQRPKKRSKLIQRTLNAVSPGAWLCDLTLDRYEVKEKKTSKKTRRGLKAMGNKSSDSE